MPEKQQNPHMPFHVPEEVHKNTNGSWPVVDLLKSWRGRYLVLGTGFCNGRWQKFQNVRTFKNKMWSTGFWELDPVRWVIPCPDGIIACRVGWPKLAAETRHPQRVIELRESGVNSRGEFDPRRNLFSVIFTVQDYEPVFRIMQPLKANHKLLDTNLYLPFDPEGSLPDVGEPHKP